MKKSNAAMTVPEFSTTNTSPNKVYYVETYHRLLVAEFRKKGAGTAMLTEFCDNVYKALKGDDGFTWLPNSDAARQAWTEIGGTGKVTIDKLRELPDTQT